VTAKTTEFNDSPITLVLTRRGFVKMGGALFVSLAFPVGLSVNAAESQTSLDPTLPASWLEVRSDNTILVRTGRTFNSSAIACA
jgi:hypothetical protein